MLDLVITGATVYPGDAPPFAGTSACSGEHDRPCDNVSQGCTSCPPAREVVDGSGLMLCPGFIDMHTHSALVSFDDPFLTPKLAQGFTTEVINPDGLAPAPVAPEGRAGASGVPPPARGRRARELALVDDRGVPRRARRDATRASLSSRRSATERCASSCSEAAGWHRPRSSSREMRRAGADRLRGGSADAVVRARLPPRRVRRARTSSSRWPRRRRPSALRSCPTCATRATACSSAISELIDVARRVGRSAASLPPQVARRREPDRAAARTARRRRDARSTSPSTSTPTAPAARCSRACCPAGRRRAARRERCRRSAAARTGAGSPMTSRTGCRAGRTSSARSGRRASRSRTRPRRTRAPWA